MTNNLFIINAPQPERLSVEALLSLLGPDKLNAIDTKAKIMREAYACPHTVSDFEAFKTTIFEFYAHYQKAFFNADYKNVTDREAARQFAYRFAEQQLGSYQGGMRAAERNAITGRDGGMIGIIDALTDSIIKLHTETYIRSVFFDRIAPSDYDTRLRLADELLKKYGQYLFPGEELLPHYFLGMNLETFIQAFATHLHSIRRDWRY